MKKKIFENLYWISNLKKMINLFDKNHLDKLIVIFSIVNTVLSMFKLITKPIESIF